MGIEPTSETWVHAATSRARLYRNGRTKVAASVHCRPPQPSECASPNVMCFIAVLLPHARIPKPDSIFWMGVPAKVPAVGFSEETPEGR
jgi:hypothetical protein